MSIKKYGFNSPGYRRASSRVREAIKAQGARATYGEKRDVWPEGTPIPPLLDHAQYKVLRAYKKWREEVRSRTDEEWFRIIDSVVEESHLRAYVYQLVWWEICETVDLNDERWKLRFEGFDYDQALNTDWPLMAYALHCCGFHPFVADRIATPCSDRTKWADNRKIEYQCPVCDEVSDGYEYEPGQCKVCYQRNSKMIRIA